MGRYLPYAIALLVFGVGALHYRAKTRPQRVFHEFFDPLPPAGFGSVRAIDPSGHPAYRQALDYHRNERYDYALMAVTAFLEDEPSTGDDYAPHLLAATSALATNDPETALYYLNKMPRRQPQAAAAHHWYRALIAVRAGDKAEAAEWLAEIDRTALTPAWRDRLEGLVSRL